MQGKAIHYYIDGNTARGFYNLLKSNIEGLDYLFEIHGVPGSGKSTLVTKLGEQWLQKGLDVEYLHSSSDYINGIILPQLRFGVVICAEEDNSITSDKAVRIDLNKALDTVKLIEYKNKITDLETKIKQMSEDAYYSFSKALAIHDEWEKIYISNMDFNKADITTNNLIDKIFKNKSLNKESIVRHRFLGAATPEGPKDFINDLTADIKKRYFIKGRPGSGKSTLFKKIAQSAQQKGFNIEIYHCGLDPNSLDMIILRQLGIAVFDSTAPHEYFPSRDNDEIIDMYLQAITPGTDEKYEPELADIIGRYKVKISQGTSFLAQAKKYSADLKIIYNNAMNYDYADKTYRDINSEISRLI